MATGGEAQRSALLGDCQTRSQLVQPGWKPDRGDGTSREGPRPTTTSLLTDHSARLTVAHRLDRRRLLNQVGVVAEVDRDLAPFRVLTGMEVDIFEDGSLDADDGILARLDVVVGGVHSKLWMSEPDMTRRMGGLGRLPTRRHFSATAPGGGDRPRPSRIDPRRGHGLRRVCLDGHRSRDQLPAGTPRPAPASSQPRVGVGVPLQRRHRAHATGQLIVAVERYQLGLAALRPRPSRGMRGRPGEGGQYLDARGDVGMDFDQV